MTAVSRSSSWLEKIVGLSRQAALVEQIPLRAAEEPLGQSRTLVLGVPEGELSLSIAEHQGSFKIVCRAENSLTARSLRSALVGEAKLVAAPREHHILAQVGGEIESAADDVARQVLAWAKFRAMRMQRIRQAHEGGENVRQQVVQGIWYDKRPNFGDVVGPWLAKQMTGQQVVNVRRTRETPTRARGRAKLMVGSIIQMLNRSEVDILGSGLMRPLTEAQGASLSHLEGIRVYGVRGHLTARELRMKLGWEVPDIYGDPALLLPYVLPAPEPKGHVSLVPHLKHRPALKRLKSADTVVSDVRGDLTSVVEEIASARLCISTSLHGLIVAQAYGIPWVWLNVVDNPVDGYEFKFDDYFSTLDLEEIPRHDVREEELPEIDLQTVAAKATKAETAVDLDLLWGSLSSSLEHPVQ